MPRPAPPRAPRPAPAPTPAPFPLTVERAALGGRLLGRAPDGRVAWVEGVVGLGDVVEARVTRAQARSVEVRAGRALAEGAGRAAPFCERVERCGGCPWQALTDAQQLEALERDVARELERAMGAPLPWAPSFWSPERAWRHTARLHLRAPAPHAPPAALGFFAPGGEVVDTPSCPTFAPALNAALRAAREALLGAASPLRGGGELRLSAARGAPSATLALALRAPLTPAARAALHATFEALCAQAGGPVHGVALSAPLAGEGRAEGRAEVGFEELSWGRPFNDLGAPGGPPVPHHAAAFMQAHQEGNAALVDEVVRGCAGDLRVLELYAGSGNLSAPLAREAAGAGTLEGAPAGGRRLTCLELDPRAVSALRALAAAEGLPLHADAQRLDALPGGVARGEFDHVVLDPPREGAAPLMEELARAPVRAISYVSCHPAALARDLAPLRARGWRVTRARLFHLFPHSGHAEVYVQLAPPSAAGRSLS